MQIKRGVLAGVICCMGTALAMSVSGYDDIQADVVGPNAKMHARSSQPNAGQQEKGLSDIGFDLSAIKRPVPNNVRSSDLFQSRSWYVPSPTSYTPVTPSTDSSPPQPAAPSLPFTFIGRVIDRNEVTLFLYKNGRQYSVKVNDLLEETYRVDRITDGSALLTYLPTNVQQELVFNSTAVGSSALSATALP